MSSEKLERIGQVMCAEVDSGRMAVEYMTSDHLDGGVRNHMTITDPSCAGYGSGLGFVVRRTAGVPGVASLVK